MTRALIVSLKLISQNLRREFLRRLLKNRYIGSQTLLGNENIGVALQGNIPILRTNLMRIPNRYIVALSGTRTVEDLEKYRDSAKFEEILTNENIRPDAWIFEDTVSPNYCFLIECKMPNEFLRADQIIAYAKLFLGIHDYDEMHQRLIILTWDEIIDTCDSFRSGGFPISEPEASILKDLREFMGFCGVISFTGIDFGGIVALPEFNMGSFIDINFQEIPELPVYEFTYYLDLGFESMPQLPDFSMNVKK
jgi:hypothetical protein